MRGSIEKRVGKHGTTWRATYEFGTDPATGKRKRHRRTFDTYREATKALAAWRVEDEQGMLVPDVPTTLGDYLEHWLTLREDRVRNGTMRATTHAQYTQIVRKHLIPGLGSILLQKLTAGQIEAFYTQQRASGRIDKEGGLSGFAVRGQHLILRAALNDAVRSGLLAQNPAGAAAAPKATKEEPKLWSVEQASLFLSAVDGDPLGPAWLLLLTCGLRRGELLGLRWYDLDLPGRLIHVRQSVVTVNGRIAVQPPKTAWGRRDIAVGAAAAAALAAHRTAQRAHKTQWRHIWTECDLVFPSALGTPLDPNNFTKLFSRLVAALNLPPIRLHDLRHLAATFALAAGGDLHEVQARLGHADIRTTSIYTHVLEHRGQAIADGVEGLLAPGSDLPSPNPSPRAFGDNKKRAV